MFAKCRFHDYNWGVGINDSAVGNFDFATYRELKRPEDNMEHWAPVLISGWVLAVPSLMGIWEAHGEAYLCTNVLVDGVRLSIWQTDEQMWHES
uniref:Uncharacterized protein n=1 Tax=Romanomermis culicivorax TaxID=13658 RepID=A0A915HY68_ROMCU